MRPRRFRFLADWLILGILGFAAATPSRQTASSIEIAGDVPKPTAVTAADIASMPRVTASVGSTNYTGVLLDDVLKRAGVPSGSALRGRALTTYVVADASDGYEAVFSLGELDPSITDNQIVLADSYDGKPLTSADGPFRIVIPKDKIGARSVRMLTKLTVVQVKR